jgi:hypothetical protein
MNTKLNFQREKNRGAKSARRFSFKLAAALASICIGAGLLLPVIKCHNASHHAMPPGQFRADMRTLVAAVHYLLAPDPVVEPQPVYTASVPPVLAHGATGQTTELPDPASRPTEPKAVASPNPPASI